MNRAAILKIVLVLLTFTAMTANAASAPEVTASSYEGTMGGLKGYCIDLQLCLNMTPAEVLALGPIIWDKKLLPNGKVTCETHGPGNVATGQFTSNYGMSFQVTFRLVNTYGEPTSRYRLDLVVMKMPNAKEEYVDRIFRGIAYRNKLKLDVPGDTATVTGGGNPSPVMLQKWDASGNRMSAIGLFGTYFLDQEWIRNLPECQSKNDKALTQSRERQ